MPDRVEMTGRWIQLKNPFKNPLYLKINLFIVYPILRIAFVQWEIYILNKEERASC
jgi:hypothetical protein